METLIQEFRRAVMELETTAHDAGAAHADRKHRSSEELALLCSTLEMQVQHARLRVFKLGERLEASK